MKPAGFIKSRWLISQKLSQTMDRLAHHERLTKRVILKIGVNGLEIVVPRRFAKRRLPGILEANREWIDKELQRVKELPSIVAPGCINLKAVDEIWQLDYQARPTSDGRFSVEEKSSTRLLIEADVDDIRGVSSILTRWLHIKAHTHLVPWLKEVSREVEIPFQKATVRGQLTRWASCSKSGNISINRSLLFLPKHLVRHVLLHELCHIRSFITRPNFGGFSTSWNLIARPWKPRSRRQVSTSQSGFISDCPRETSVHIIP